MSTILIAVVAIITVNGLDALLAWRFKCHCGRRRTWYYLPSHPRSGVMIGRAIWVTLCTVILLIGVEWQAVLLGLLATYYWRAWWFHEKDKLKRKAARALGRVSINEHGLLVVKGTS